MRKTELRTGLDIEGEAIGQARAESEGELGWAS